MMIWQEGASLLTEGDIVANCIRKMAQKKFKGYLVTSKKTS